MSRLSDLHFKYLHSELANSGDTPTTLVADGGHQLFVQDAALTEANDYWNGSIARWITSVAAQGNAGRWSSISDFTASNDRAFVADALPTRVGGGVGDTYMLLRGGGHASSVRVPIFTTPASLLNVTGFTLAHVSGMNGEGTGTLHFSASGQSLAWEPPREAAGAPRGISGLLNGQSITLYGNGATLDQRSKFVVVTRAAAPLPTEDTADDVSIDITPFGFLARITGVESEAGITVYRPVAVRNTAGNSIFSVAVYCPKPFPGAASTALFSAMSTGAATLRADDLTGWGTHGWVRNVTKDDVRYYIDRSGNAATIVNPSGGHRGFTAVAWDIDDEIEPYPWFDIGLDAPGTADIFESPATRETAPSGVTFTCPTTVGDGLSIGTLAANGVHCIWMRFTIVAGSRPIENGRAELRVSCEVTEEL